MVRRALVQLVGAACPERANCPEPGAFGPGLVQEDEVGHVVAHRLRDFSRGAGELRVHELRALVEGERLGRGEGARGRVRPGHETRDGREEHAVGACGRRVADEVGEVALVAALHAVVGGRHFAEVGEEDPPPVLHALGADDCAPVLAVGALRVPHVRAGAAVDVAVVAHDGHEAEFRVGVDEALDALHDGVVRHVRHVEAVLVGLDDGIRGSARELLHLYVVDCGLHEHGLRERARVVEDDRVLRLHEALAVHRVDGGGRVGAVEEEGDPPRYEREAYHVEELVG